MATSRKVIGYWTPGTPRLLSETAERLEDRDLSFRVLLGPERPFERRLRAGDAENRERLRREDADHRIGIPETILHQAHPVARTERAEDVHRERPHEPFRSLQLGDDVRDVLDGPETSQPLEGADAQLDRSRLFRKRLRHLRRVGAGVQLAERGQ